MVLVELIVNHFSGDLDSANRTFVIYLHIVFDTILMEEVVFVTRNDLDTLSFFEVLPTNETIIIVVFVLFFGIEFNLYLVNHVLKSDIGITSVNSSFNAD